MFSGTVLCLSILLGVCAFSVTAQNKSFVIYELRSRNDSAILNSTDLAAKQNLIGADSVLQFEILAKMTTFNGTAIIGSPSNGCGPEATKIGAHDPDSSVLVLEYNKDSDNRNPDSECNLLIAAETAKQNGWKFLLFGGDNEFVTWSPVSFSTRLNGLVIYYGGSETYDTLRRIDSQYEITKLAIRPFASAHRFSSQGSVIFLVFVLITFGLLVLSFIIYKYSLFWQINKWQVSHTSVTYLSNSLSVMCSMVFDLLLWIWLWSGAPGTILDGFLALAIGFITAGNFTLVMWWSGFLYPMQEKRFHSRILMFVIDGFIILVAATQFVLSMYFSKTHIANTIFGFIGYILMFIVAIYTVVIGFVVTAKFIYQRPNKKNQHIKSLRNREAKQLMVLLLGSGFTSFALAFLGLIAPRLGPITSLSRSFLQIYFLGFICIVNVFLMTLLHNNNNNAKSKSVSHDGGSSESALSSLASFSQR